MLRMMEWLCFSVHKKKKSKQLLQRNSNISTFPSRLDAHSYTTKPRERGFPMGAQMDAHSAHRGDGEHVRTEG